MIYHIVSSYYMASRRTVDTQGASGAAGFLLQWAHLQAMDFYMFSLSVVSTLIRAVPTVASIGFSPGGDKTR